MSVEQKVNDEQKLSDGSENTCVVCFKNVEIYSIGECDHPVCYECSTRMRVLCEQNECPICRQGLSKVIFTNEKRSYRELETSNRSEYYNKKYKICFSNINIQKAFYDLLEHPCPKCDARPFRSFDALKDHVRKEHELFYCDICTEHLKIFSFERKCYNRQQLGTHRRVGDPDNTSHKGHPLCHYCDCRYLDRDELFRHLRREHYYCHFCDADGSNQFYADYDSLRDHFRKEHYLCEEGDCIREKFTVVFRTEIDLKAHIANVHGKSMGKLLAKQARTLQLEITLGPRGRSNQQDQTMGNHRSRGNNEYQETERYESYTVQNPPRTIDAQNEQEFPSLGGTGASSAVTLIRPNMSIRTKSFGPAGLARTKENFPALGNTNNIPDTGPNLPGSSKYNQPPVSAILKKNTNVPQAKTNTGGGSMVIHVSNRPKSSIQNPSSNMKKVNQNDFPALPGSSRNQNNFFKEDFIPPNPSISLSSVSSKHRSLIDNYVSVAQPNSSKLSFVQKEAEKPQKKQVEQTFNASKLNSSEFPALASAAPVQDTNWVKSQKQQNKENRKSKVAQAPILNGPYLEPSFKKINEKKDSQKKNPTATDTESNNNKNNNKKVQKTNEKKSTTITTTTTTKSTETIKPITKTKDKKNDNNNENKTTNRNVSKMNDKNVENSSKNDVNKNSEFKKTFDEKDFPGLGKNTFPAPPPPGFDVKLNGSKQPPPGFKSVTLNSVAKPANNMTFTNSLGENYSIVPNHQYIAPPNLAKRNQELVKHFQGALKSHEAVEEFRFISQKFREGLYKASPYFEHCQAALRDKFDVIFPELLVLLPDITKQQELFLVYSQYLKSKNQQKQRTNLEVCTTCKQILLKSDLSAHLQDHQLDNNFPVLSLNDSGNSIISDGIRK